MASIITFPANASGIPSIEPQAAPPDSYQKIASTPDAFGAKLGAAEQTLGESALKVGHVYGQLAGQQAATGYQDEARKILNGDPDVLGDVGILGKHNQEFMDAHQGALQQLKALRTKWAATVPTADAQILFNNEVRYFEAQTDRVIGSQYDRESKGWGGQVQDARYKNAVADAAVYPEDEDAATNALATANSALTQKSQMNGELPRDPANLTPDQAAFMTNQQRGALIHVTEERIKALIGTGNTTAAQRIFDQHRSVLASSPHFDAIAGHLAAQTDKAEREAEKARDGAIVDGIFGGAVPGTTGPRRRGSGATGASGDLWSRIKGAEGGLGRGGEALVSPKGAIGISQIIPSTARTVAADLGLPYDERRLHTDQAYNEKLGSHYLDQQMEKYNGNEALAAAAYNAGPHRVDEWLQTIGDPRTGAITDAQFAEKIPFGETRAYVKKIIAGTPREGMPTPLYTPGTLAPGTDAGTAAEQFAAGAARPTGATAAAAPATKFARAAGDSIAAQQIRHGMPGSEANFKAGADLPGTARVGAHPSEVLRRINDEVAADPKAFAGVNFLSSGASNNPDDAGFVGDQIDALKKGGATAVVVPGVGPGVKNAAAVNASLKSVVEEHGGTFFQPQIKWQPDGVHPAEVDKVRDQGLAALRKAGPQAAAGGAPAAQVTPPAFDTAHADGMVKPGNLDPWNRPVLKNPDGGYSTTSSMSIGTDDGEVLIPTVVDGKRLSNDDAIAHFKATGENLGTFSTPAAADAYATALHDAQASMYDAKGNPKTPAPPDQLQGKPAPSPMTAPVPYLPTREEMIARIPEGMSEEGYNRVLAKVNQRYSHMLQATSADRAQALSQYKGGLAMLQDGREFNYDPNTYRRLFPKEDADRMTGELEDARTIGQQIQTVRGMPLSDIVTQRVANQAVLAHSTGEGYAHQKKRADAFYVASEKHIKELGEDPAGYVALHNPFVAAKFAAIDPTKPETFADYAHTALAEQERLGVSEAGRTVLPTSVAAAQASKLGGLDPAKVDIGRAVAGVAKSYGAGTANDYWPQVLGDLVKAKLPGTYQVLATMDRPDQTVAAADLSRAIGLVAEKGGMSALKKAVPDETQKAIDKALDGALADFRGSVGLQSGGARLYATVRDASQSLAYYYGFRGQSDSEAVQSAVNGIINTKYDFGTIGAQPVRVPKGTLGVVDSAAAVVQGGVNAEQLGNIPGNPILSPEQRKEVWLGAIHRGGWANNEDDSGLVLMGHFRNGAYGAVHRADGSRIELKFSDAAAIAKSATIAPAEAWRVPY